MTIPNAEGELSTPSVVLYEEDGSIVVGREAKRVSAVLPDRVAECAKRFMGDGSFPSSLGGEQRSPVEISSEILKKLRKDAAARIGPIDGAVVTVPAYFDELRRQATAEACSLAGIPLIDIINEPTSAALAYAYKAFITRHGASHDLNTVAKALGEPRTVIVYDLGGGTFDVSLLRIEGTQITVLATEGDVRLGGRDWDERIVQQLADAFTKQYGSDPRDTPTSYQALLSVAENLKKDLSSRSKSYFNVQHDGNAMSGEFSREEFEKLSRPLLFRTERRLERVMEAAKLDWSKIDKVLLVGGSTRMPQVREMIEQVSGKEPDTSLSPDEAVAHGAAIHAAVTVAQFEPGTMADRAKGFLHRFNDRVMKVIRAIRTTNVNAHSLGVEVVTESGKRRVSVLIPRNTPLPVTVSKRYGIVEDNQRTVSIRMTEGESKDPHDCIEIGTCRIEPLPPALKRGSPVDVTFTYDNSGRLHVKAVEGQSRSWASVTIARQFGIGSKQGTPS